jgi:hypothetical protein
MKSGPLVRPGPEVSRKISLVGRNRRDTLESAVGTASCRTFPLGRFERRDRPVSCRRWRTREKRQTTHGRLSRCRSMTNRLCRQVAVISTRALRNPPISGDGLAVIPCLDYFDQPFGDSSCIPTYLSETRSRSVALSRRRRRGVRGIFEIPGGGLVGTRVDPRGLVHST